MRPWIVGWIVLVLVGGATAAVWSSSTKGYAHRFRIEIVVLNNGEQHTADSTVEVIWSHQPSIFVPVPEYAQTVRGEAPVVNLGDGRLLVALMGPADVLYRPVPWEYLAMVAYGLPEDNSSIPLIARQSGVRELRGNQIPALILFQNAVDPASARIVKPSADGLLAPGLFLKAVTIEITNDAPRFTIQQKLPWWSSQDQPFVAALRAWLVGTTYGSSVEVQRLFIKR